MLSAKKRQIHILLNKVKFFEVKIIIICAVVVSFVHTHVPFVMTECVCLMAASNFKCILWLWHLSYACFKSKASISTWSVAAAVLVLCALYCSVFGMTTISRDQLQLHWSVLQQT